MVKLLPIISEVKILHMWDVDNNLDDKIFIDKTHKANDNTTLEWHQYFINKIKK